MQRIWICVFDFAYAKIWFSHDATHLFQVPKNQRAFTSQRIHVVEDAIINVNLEAVMVDMIRIVYIVSVTAVINGK